MLSGSSTAAVLTTWKVGCSRDISSKKALEWFSTKLAVPRNFFMKNRDGCRAGVLGAIGWGLGAGCGGGWGAWGLDGIAAKHLQKQFAEFAVFHGLVPPLVSYHYSGKKEKWQPIFGDIKTPPADGTGLPGYVYLASL